MTELDNHRNKITSTIWEFVDKIANGKVETDVLEAHGISIVAINAVRTPSYVGINLYRKKIFMHLMNSVGYYDLLRQGEDKVKTLTIAEVNKRLYNPLQWHDFQRKEMREYPLVAGVKASLDYINNTLPQRASCGKIGNIVPENSIMKKVSPGYEISFSKPYDPNLSENFNHSLEGTSFLIGSNSFKIQQHGCHISKWSRTLLRDDEISICLTHFNTNGISPEKAYYQRYFIEVPDWGIFTRNIGFGFLSLDGNECRGSLIDIKGCSYAIYFFSNREKNFVAIDSNVKVTELEMRDVAFSISVALGLLGGHLYLGEYWMVSSEDKKRRKPIGMLYSSLSPSIHSDYNIFTTNIYSVLLPIAKKIDPENGEKRALSIIEKNKLAYAIDAIEIRIFEKLVENFEQYESLRRGIYILLTGTRLSLELQPGAFAIALEAICNITKEIIPPNKGSKLSKTAWKIIRPKLENLCEEQRLANKINPNECDYLKQKIQSLNNGFNSDKLKSLLEYYNYPLTDSDYDVIKFRNPLLHGDIKIRKMNGTDFDNLFSLSLRLHKLCCSIPLLMAGYRGYILNNCKLYGYDSGKAFIKLGHGKPHNMRYEKSSSTNNNFIQYIRQFFDTCLRFIGIRKMFCCMTRR